MYSDVENIYCDDQAITVTADSTNTINQLADNQAYKEQWLDVRVTELFAGGTSVAIDLVYDDDSAFGSAVTMEVIPATVVASLTLGAVLYRQRLPQGFLQHSKLVFTVVGTPTAGTIKGQLVPDVPQAR